MQTQAQPENITLARRFVEGVLGGQDPSVFDDIVADNIRVATGLKPDGDIRGKEEYRAILTKFGSAFTNGRLTITDIFASADGERVVVLFDAYATHTGELFDVQPTNVEVPMIETHVMRFRDGKLVENIVGGNNPLGFEMLLADAIRPMVLPEMYGPPKS